MRIFTLLCAAVFSVFLPGCATYDFTPKVVSASSKYPAVIERAEKDKRYFILQSGINIYNVTSVDVDQAKEHVTVTLDKVDSIHLMYFKNPQIKRNVAAAGRTPFQSEIHMYTKDSTSYTMDEPHTITMQNIARIELLGKG